MAPRRSAGRVARRRGETKPSPPPDITLSNVLVRLSGCCVAIDKAWRVTGLTREAAAWLGVGECDLLGLDLRQCMAVPEPLFDAVETSFTIGLPSQAEIPWGPEGARRIKCQVHPFATGATMLFWDVTDQRLAEQAVELANDLLQGVADALTAEIIVFDEAGVVASLNAAARASIGAIEQLGVPSGVGSRYVDVCRSLIPGIEELVLLRGLDDLIAARSRSFAHVCATDAPSGPRWRQVRITRFGIGPAVRFIAIHEDQTEVAHTREALHQTSERLLSAQEDERERIAVELHDSTSQHLVALGLGVTRLRRLLAEEAGMKEVLDDMSNSVREAVREIRVFAYLMKPPSLARDGLEATVRAFVRGFGLRTSLTASFRAEGRVDCADADVRHAAFRVAQEALSNVYRHARAHSLKVELTSRDGLLTLAIADDGVGFVGAAGAPDPAVPLGVGITGMRARVEQLGGKLDVASTGAGTVVTARIPLGHRGPASPPRLSAELV